MTPFLRALFLTLALLGLASCGQHSKFRTYHGVPITAIEVHKADRKMYMLHDTTVLKTYEIQLGGNPIGPKQFEGDGKTPEGAYLISHRNPNSTYHLSLGISYPNTAQVDFAAAQGKKAGDNIFIHGQPGWTKVKGDWTVGCIAVTDKEIEEIYAMVNPGTQINIFP